MIVGLQSRPEAIRASETRFSKFGPLVGAGGTTFRLWAPSLAAVSVVIDGHEPVAMTKVDSGWFEDTLPHCGEGTRYRFSTGDLTFPDPASRQQDTDADGWSVVRAPLPAVQRSCPVRPWHEAIICEVHIGTASPEGTFRGLHDRLEHFRDAGFTCLEVMPVNEFPGRRNWGYDGTLLFAPESAYGTPEDLRTLVDRAHALGLTMILDVVYNHFGETDNFIQHYAPEWFDAEVETPWGPGINFNQPMVRQFYYENAVMWLTEYDFDGLRFDSVHEMKTASRDHFLGELADIARTAKPHARLITENVENSFRWLERDERNAPMTYTAQWNDDMHHVLDFLVTGDGRKTGYDEPGKDPYADFEKALADRFVHDPAEGDGSDGRTRGGPAGKLPPDSFITYVHNHDQIGNRADGKRLPERTSPQKLDFAHFVKLLAPQIPLCFMGDEANMSSGFPFFVDLPEAAAKAKRDDRYRQMRDIFKEEISDGDLPEPNAPSTFHAAKLRWDEYTRQDRARSLDRFRMLVGFRRELLWPLSATPCLDAETTRIGNCLIINWVFQAGTLSMAINPTERPMDIPCIIYGPPVWTGGFSQHGNLLRLGAWSAVAWVGG